MFDTVINPIGGNGKNRNFMGLVVMVDGQCIVRTYVELRVMVDGVITEVLAWLQCKMNFHR